MSKKSLAIETSTSICSVALKLNDGNVISRSTSGMGIHSEKAIMFVSEVTEQAGISFYDIDQIVLNGGPGSFTGLRISTSLVKGLLFNSTASFSIVDGLASIALKAAKIANPSKRIHAVVNARRTHLYHRIFKYDRDTNYLFALNDAATRPISDIVDSVEDGDIIAGDGVNRLPDIGKSSKIISASDVIMAESLLDVTGLVNSQDYSNLADVNNFEPVYKLPEVMNTPND